MNSRKAPDASKMGSFVRAVSACRSRYSRVLDLQAALREAPRVLDGRSGIPGGAGVPKGFELVDEVSLRSFNATFARIIPQAQLLVCQGTDFIVHVTDLFGDGAIATLQVAEPLVDAFACFGRLYLICRSGVTVMNLETRARDFLNLQITDSLTCQCSAGALEVQRALGPAMVVKHDSPISAAVATSRRVFIADVRGKIAEITWSSGLPVIKVLGNKIREVLLGRREKIVQLTSDQSRDLLFSLSESGIITAYIVSNEQFKQVRGQVTQKDAVSIAAIPSSMSASLCLCSVDSHGRTNFYTLNDQISSHFTEIGVSDPIEAVELRKCFSDKIGPAERIQCLGVRVQAGNFFYISSDQVEYFGVDQSISKSNKPFAISGSLGAFSSGNETILDLHAFPHRLPFTTPSMGVEYQEVQALQFEQFQNQKFIGVVTNQRVLIYSGLRMREMIKRMLMRSEAEAVREFLGRFLDENEVIEVFLSVLCEADRPDVSQQLQLARRCLIQFTMADSGANFGTFGGSGPNSGAWAVLEDCARYRPAVFLAAAQQLLAKMLMPVFAYQLFYSPFNFFQQKVEVGRHEIPVRNLLIQQKRAGGPQLATPVVLFSYLELFNLGVAISNVSALLDKFMPQLSKMQPFGTYPANSNLNQTQNNQNPLFNNKGGNQSTDDLTCGDLSGCSVYVKELLFFFSLCFNPQNAGRVVPELMQLSNNTQTGQAELPVFQFGFSSLKQQNQGLYVTTPALTFQYYLDSANKHDMEVLVRKLNMILNQQQTNNVFRLNQKAYQESFDRVFSTMCKYLSKIYVSRLQALQELEQAAATRGQHERSRRVSAAVKQLKAARSLAPVEPLIDVFTKADAVKDLVTLILHTYNGQLQQLNSHLKRTNFQALYTDFQTQIQRFKALYNQQNVSYAFSMLHGAQVPPYTLEPLLSSPAIAEAISGTAQQFRADLTAPNAHPDTTALKESTDVIENIFKLIQTHFVYNGLSQVINNLDAGNNGTNGKEYQQRGLSVILAAVQGNTTELWHIMLYEYLYLHYIAASCYIDLAQKKQQAVRDAGKQVIQCFTLIQQRCQSALIDIRSPYIEQFLLGVDYELYIKQMRKQRRYGQLLVFIKQVLESGTTQSVLPNSYENGVFSAQTLDFQQSLQLIQLACTICRYEGGNQEFQSGNSIFATSVGVGASMSTDKSFTASVSSQEQFKDYFGKYLQLAGVQNLFIERLHQNGVEREVEMSRKSLWSPVQLQQRLQEGRMWDLQLILQYNVIRKLNAHHFSEQEVGFLYDQLFTPQGGVEVNQSLQKSVEMLHFVLNQVELDAVMLKLPVYKLVNANLGLFQQDPEKASLQVVTSLFKPQGTQRPYKYIGNFCRATVLLLQDYKNNGALAEAFGWLAIKLVEMSRVQAIQVADDEQIAPGRVLERIRQVCPTVPRLQAEIRRFQ